MSSPSNGRAGISRRRFISIAAGLVAGPAAAASPLPEAMPPQAWRSFAMGAEVSIELCGATPQHAARLFEKIAGVLDLVEEHFSLFRDSALTRLNRMGRLSHPPPAVLEVFRQSDLVHAATGGMFDPTIQPLWLALANSGDVAAARALAGWHRVRFSAEEIVLEPGMQLTFNGIAQGHAADQVAALLKAAGFGDVLIDTGEIAGLGMRPDGTPWRAAIAMPDGAIVGGAALSDRALAVSSPLGTRIGKGLPHIIDPRGGMPVWQLAAVSAAQAALADALSTAFCMMERPAIAQALAQFPDARAELLA